MKGLITSPWTFVFAFALLCLFWGCSEFARYKLIGTWEGIALEEEGKAIPIDASQIQMTFREDGSYSYESTLNYRESGSFYLDGSLLHRTDTLNRASRERAVEIIRLEADTLSFRMEENGRERILQLVRK